jgi:hypothetical protein
VHLVGFTKGMTKNVWTVHESGLVQTLSHNDELCGLLEGPDIVKYEYSKFKWILLTFPPKKVLNGKLHGRRPVRRPRLRWENNRRDFSLLLSRLTVDSDLCCYINL